MGISNQNLLLRFDWLEVIKHWFIITQIFSCVIFPRIKKLVILNIYFQSTFINTFVNTYVKQCYINYNCALIHVYDNIEKVINFNMEKNQNKLRLFFAFALISIASTDTGKVFIHELTHTAWKICYYSFNITFYFMDNDAVIHKLFI